MLSTLGFQSPLISLTFPQSAPGLGPQIPLSLSFMALKHIYKNVLKLIVVMVAQHCELLKLTHQIELRGNVNCISIKLLLQNKNQLVTSPAQTSPLNFRLIYRTAQFKSLLRRFMGILSSSPKLAFPIAFSILVAGNPNSNSGQNSLIIPDSASSPTSHPIH